MSGDYICPDCRRLTNGDCGKHGSRSGIKEARAMGAGPHADLIEALKEQLLIAFLKRLGGKVSIPCAEVDDTSRDMLAFNVDGERTFHFEIRKKS